MTEADARGVIVVIPALNEERRVAATVTAAASIPAVAGVVVVDDGSNDRTATLAAEAGAEVVSHPRRRGKAAALESGAARAAELHPSALLLFLDADLEDSAAAAGPLVEPVLTGAADMTIATLPRAPGAGGHGFVVGLASRGIERRTGWVATQPLSGQRCLTRELFERVTPLASGFGVEVGLTIDALKNGGRVVECPVELRHRVTGTSWRDQLHRAKQYRDVWLALRRR